jgi:acetyl esterase
MAERLQAAGVATRAVTYRGASHSFLEAMSIESNSNQALSDASAWLGQALEKPGSGALPGAVA